VKILWILATPTYARNFESAIRALAERGHEIVLGVESEGVQIAGLQTLPDRLAAEYPGITQERVPALERDRWAPFRLGVAHALDALRFHEPSFEDTPYLRERAVVRAPMPLRTLLSPSLTSEPRRRRVLRAVLRAAERSVPLSRCTTDYIRAVAPDMILVTPYVDFGTPQSRWVRSARAAGVRSGITVYSWDALTVRGQIREIPELVTVWNDTQVGDAVDLHGVPRDRVVATGAQAYDHWFAWAPATERDEFCAQVGLPADRPYLLYLASSGGYMSRSWRSKTMSAPSSSKGEAAWVIEWIERLRASGRPELADIGVLVRPHPKTKEDWHAIERSGLPAVRVWPPQRSEDGTSVQLSDYNIASPRAKSEFYDSIHHSTAVVGVNTSALIESAIVGRPVHTVLDPRWRYAQEETLHFRQLVQVAGGFLDVAADFDEHAEQLARSVAAGGSANSRSRRFLEAFIRPQGLEVEATGRFVATIEDFAGTPAPKPHGRSPASAALGAALTPVAELTARLPDDPQQWDWAAKRWRRRGRVVRRYVRRRRNRARKRIQGTYRGARRRLLRG
jgi:hypothetical protein